jgi:hypothetical protein
VKLAVMQPYFFPYIGYFQLIHAVDKILLYSRVNYIKRGWVNRNRVLAKTRGPSYVTVPVRDASSYRIIGDVEIDNSTPWKSTMLRSIYHEYRRSPHFHLVYTFLEALLTRPYEKLDLLNIDTVRAVVALLGITTDVSVANENHIAMERVLDNTPSADRKTQRLLELCRHERASTYLNPVGGKLLYDKSVFAQNGVELLFLESIPTPYPQSASEFVPHLSIIDVLFNCGVEGTRHMLDNYQLS